MYQVSAEPERKFVKVKLSGFLTAQEVYALEEDIRAAIARFGSDTNDHVVLINSSDCTAQSQDIVAAFQAVLNKSRRPSRRLAVVNSSALLRIQTRRMLVRESTAVFETHEEAESWLFEGTN